MKKILTTKIENTVLKDLVTASLARFLRYFVTETGGKGVSYLYLFSYAIYFEESMHRAENMYRILFL